MKNSIVANPLLRSIFYFRNFSLCGFRAVYLLVALEMVWSLRLHQHPKVQLAISSGIPDNYRGETVKAFVVLKKGEQATADNILAFCRTKLAAYKVPGMDEFREPLPQSAVGKVLRRMLRDEEVEKRKKS